MFSGVDDIEDLKPLKLTIRSFDSGDLSGVLRIERISFTEPWSPNMFDAFYQINPKGFYVAAINEDIVGYGIVLMGQNSIRLSKKKGTAHLMNLAVDPRFRNKGIGGQLVGTIIADIKRAGGDEIYLEVRASNTNAIAFYLTLGFKKIGNIKRFYGNEDAVMMAINI